MLEITRLIEDDAERCRQCDGFGFDRAAEDPGEDCEYCGGTGGRSTVPPTLGEQLEVLIRRIVREEIARTGEE